MSKTISIPIIFLISLIFITAGLAAEEKTNTFGLKTGKELFNAKDGALPEIKVADAMDKIGLEVQIATEAKNENALYINSVSVFDRGGEFFKNKNHGIKYSEKTVLQLHKAIESGELEDIKRLQLGIDFNFQDKRGITPLYLSVFHNQTKLVSYYLANNADINLSDHEGLTPLHVACLENLPDMVHLLLDNGAKLNASDKDGYTPLHIAIDQNSFNAANELLAAGAQVDSKAVWGHTPLHTAVATGYLTMVQNVLGEGGQIKAKDRLGRTPLHWAAEKGHLKSLNF